MDLINILASGLTSSGELEQLGTATWLLSDIFRSLFYFLDCILYYLVPELYNLALRLADIREALNQQTIVNAVSEGLYYFFALVMFFRYVFAILTMIADPEKIEDKQKGLGKIVMNSIVAIILVISVPTIFDIAYDAQKILIGEPGVKGGLIYNAFTKIGGSDSDAVVAVDTATKATKQVFEMFVEPVSGYDGPTAKDLQAAWSDYKSKGVFRGILLSKYIDDDYKDNYGIAYLAPLSTLVAAFLVWTLLTTAIEIALRSIKLFALQIVSPIAIITYVDPDSASKGIFKKWLDECVKTYLSLFFRIFVLSFFITIMSNINFAKILSMGFWVLLFFILGLMSFIKIAPKMFEEIFGFKLSDDTKFGRQLLGAATGGILGAAAGGIIGAGYAKARGASIGRSLAQGARGGFGGLKSGGKAGYSGSPGKMAWSGVTGAKSGIKDIKGSKPYKTYSEAHDKLKEDNKSMEAYKEYSAIYDAHKGDAVASRAELLSTQARYAPGGSEPNPTKYNEATANLNAFNTDAELKKDYTENRAKRIANERTYGAASPVTKTLANSYDKEWQAKRKRNEYAQSKSDMSSLQSQFTAAKSKRDNLEIEYNKASATSTAAQSKYAAAAAAPPGTYTTSEIAQFRAESDSAASILSDIDTNFSAANTDLATMQTNYNNVRDLVRATELEYDNAQKGSDKAGKVRDAVLDSPANATDAEKYKRISRGKNISPS